MAHFNENVARVCLGGATSQKSISRSVRSEDGGAKRESEFLAHVEVAPTTSNGVFYVQRKKIKPLFAPFYICPNFLFSAKFRA